MTSGVNPGAIAGVSPATGTQAVDATRFQPGGGNVLPQSGKTAAAAASSAAGSSGAKAAAASRSDPQTLVDQVNKYLNDSGRPDEFRVDPDSGKFIQQVNPATGAVVGEYLVSEFPALARSVGASSLLIDDLA